MKRAMNFRFSQQTVNTLFLLESKLHVTKTAVIEAALKEFAKSKLSKENELLAYAGILKDTEADSVLDYISRNRHNKNKDIKL
jgi:hypothetical protein